MLARLVALPSVLSVAIAWPIFFYEGDKCDHYPIITLVVPPTPNTCFTFEGADVQSHIGGTRDSVENIILYDDLQVCQKDAAHRAYANYTISNNHTACQSVPNVLRAYVFIEEILGPLPNAAIAASESTSQTLGCNALTAQL
ncbi:hypothetical protein JB92DRAFT_2954136, partial [Gautieria morchelliformis]